MTFESVEDVETVTLDLFDAFAAFNFLNTGIDFNSEVLSK